MIALFLAQRIVLGKFTFDEVPSVLQDDVRQILVESGLGFLIK